MITLEQCARFANLEPHEILAGVSPETRHDALLQSYMFNIGRGEAVVREMMVADLRRFLDLGARARAADALVVLRLFLTLFPRARAVAAKAGEAAAAGRRFRKGGAPGHPRPAAPTGPALLVAARARRLPGR